MTGYMRTQAMWPAVIAVAMALAVLVTPAADYAHAQTIGASIITIGTTSLITITNDGGADITEINLWFVDNDNTFKSFKTESGWTGTKVQQDHIIFTSPAAITAGQSVKIGVNTELPVSEINWSASDAGGNLLITSIASQDGPEPVVEETPDDTVIEEINGGGEEEEPPPKPDNITIESDFRVIPDTINIGSTIRVIGEKFGPETSFVLHINDFLIGTFVTDDSGSFVTTSNIPNNVPAERVDFIVRDIDGNEISRSLKINPTVSRPESPIAGHNPDQVAPPITRLSVSGVPEIVNIGDRLQVHGTANPGSTIVTYIKGGNGIMYTSNVITADESGGWSIPESHIVGTDMKIGSYVVGVTDGNEVIEKTWNIVTNNNISIQPSKSEYKRGEVMRFVVGTTDNAPLKVNIENPKNISVYSDIIPTSGTNSTVFEYTVNHRDLDGTYTVIVSQNGIKEYAFVGVNKQPTTKIVFELDKVNYGSSETPTISIAAEPTDIVKLNILDSSDSIIHTESIAMQSDGRRTFTLGLQDYRSGLYTAEVEKGTEKISREFTVGLQSGTNIIEVMAINPPYHPGDQFLISIDTGDVIVPLIVTMTDPDGDVVSVKETFSRLIQKDKDKDRRTALETLLIPSSGKIGVWTVTASSGGNTNSIDVDVVPVGLSIHISEVKNELPLGKYVDITVIGAKQTIWLKVTSTDGEGAIIGSEQKITLTGDGSAVAKWPIPADTIHGTYTMIITDAHNQTVEKDFVIE